MHGSSSRSWLLFEPEALRTWCARLVVLAVSLAFLALLAGVATGERGRRDPLRSAALPQVHTPGPATSFLFGERARARRFPSSVHARSEIGTSSQAPSRELSGTEEHGRS